MKKLAETPKTAARPAPEPAPVQPTTLFALEAPAMPDLMIEGSPFKLTVDKKTVEKILERMKEL